MRNILITGGSGGIGAAMVRRFARAGDRVVFTWNTGAERAAALAAETGAIPLRADLTVPGAAGDAVAAAAGENDRLDVLVCCAGAALSRMLMDTEDAEYRRVMDANVYTAFAAARAAMQRMFWQRSGVILTISSIWGETGGSCEAVYSAAKAAVIGMTRALAREAAGAGVRVNCLAPGMIDTPMNDCYTPEEKADICREIPLGRMGTPAEVAETAFFLAGEGAAYITGQVIGVNGGWHI